jgi:hypothetical protein
MDLSVRSVMIREGRGSPRAAMAFNMSGARFSSCSTCATLARETPCCRAKSAWVAYSPVPDACCHS